jgi:putative transposase
MSEQTTCRKTYQEKLRPTPTQERALERVLWCCRTLYNTALQQRITAWQRCHICLTRYQQEAELTAIREAFPEYAALHSHVLQDVLARLDTTYQAFFRRLAAGRQPGFPRFQGRERYHSFTSKEYGNGARLENGSLVLSTIGRLAVRWSRPVPGSIKTVTVSREADGWYVCCSCAEVPTVPLPLTGAETGIDVGLQVFLVTADGQPLEHPRHYRKADTTLRKAQQRVCRRKKGSKRRQQAVQVLARTHQHVRRRQRQDFHHKTALTLVRAYDAIYMEAIQPANVSRRPAPKPDEHGTCKHNAASQKAGLNTSMQDAGWRHFLSILAYTAACAGKRVEASGSGQPGVYAAGLQRLRRTGVQEPVRSHARLHQLRTHARLRRERGAQHPMARTAPSGTRGDACGEEPRTRGAVAPAECQIDAAGGVVEADGNAGNSRRGNLSSGIGGAKARGGCDECGGAVALERGPRAGGRHSVLPFCGAG